MTKCFLPAERGLIVLLVQHHPDFQHLPLPAEWVAEAEAEDHAFRASPEGRRVEALVRAQLAAERAAAAIGNDGGGCA